MPAHSHASWVVLVPVLWPKLRAGPGSSHLSVCMVLSPMLAAGCSRVWIQPPCLSHATQLRTSSQELHRQRYISKARHPSSCGPTWAACVSACLARRQSGWMVHNGRGFDVSYHLFFASTQPHVWPIFTVPIARGLSEPRVSAYTQWCGIIRPIEDKENSLSSGYLYISTKQRCTQSRNLVGHTQ